MQSSVHWGRKRFFSLLSNSMEISLGDMFYITAKSSHGSETFVTQKAGVYVLFSAAGTKDTAVRQGPPWCLCINIRSTVLAWPCDIWKHAVFVANHDIKNHLGQHIVEKKSEMPACTKIWIGNRIQSFERFDQIRFHPHAQIRHTKILDLSWHISCRVQAHTHQREALMMIWPFTNAF